MVHSSLKISVKNTMARIPSWTIHGVSTINKGFTQFETRTVLFASVVYENRKQISKQLLKYVFTVKLAHYIVNSPQVQIT